MPEAQHSFDVCIVGGLGHVGLPLGLVLADKGLRVCLNDVDEQKAETVRNGQMPFIEYEAEDLLRKTLANGRLEISLDPRTVGAARYVIIAIGTPVDEYLNPKTRQFMSFFTSLQPHLSPDQTIVIRSTVYPRTCEQIRNTLGPGDWKIAYCPERIVQGYAVRELSSLPQIVAGLSPEAEHEAAELFEEISPKVIRTTMGEAELVKLFANAWRYTLFAMANQFFMISHRFGVDYEKVREAMKEGYDRASNLPRAGFAAGPCLLKDTMQLAAFSTNNFMLGHAAMMVNEGLPNFLVEEIDRSRDLGQSIVGILGMAFKADIDDIRDSLSYKLGKILRFRGAEVRYSDEFARDPTFVTKEQLVEQSDIVIVAIPHSAYRELAIPDGKFVVDLWGIVRGGERFV